MGVVVFVFSTFTPFDGEFHRDKRKPLKIKGSSAPRYSPGRVFFTRAAV
jgi:hypothetical protein